VLELAKPIMENLGAMQIFIAETPGERRIQRRIETALMQAVYHAPGGADQLLERGLRLEPRRDDEPPFLVCSTPEARFEGVPDRFEA
jgi:hypothetical protein